MALDVYVQTDILNWILCAHATHTDTHQLAVKLLERADASSHDREIMDAYHRGFNAALGAVALNAGLRPTRQTDIPWRLPARDER